MSTRSKIALGSALSMLGALVFVLTMLLGWTVAPSPWDSLLAFVVGAITGLGATLAITGLIERRRTDRRQIGS